VRDNQWVPRGAPLLSLPPAGIFALVEGGIFLITSAHAFRSSVDHVQADQLGRQSGTAHRRKGYVHSVPARSRQTPPSATLGFFRCFPPAGAMGALVTGFGFNVAEIPPRPLLGLFASVAVLVVAARVFGGSGPTAARALIFLSPGAFVLSMGLHRGRSSCSSPARCFALQRRRWAPGGAFAPPAATRPRSGGDRGDSALRGRPAWSPFAPAGEWRSILAPLTHRSAWACFFLYLWFHTGSPFSWLHAQRVGWQKRLSGHRDSRAMLHFFDHGFVDPNYGRQGRQRLHRRWAAGAVLSRASARRLGLATWVTVLVFARSPR